MVAMSREERLAREAADADAEAWDRQIEADAQNGKLARLAERALRDYEAGRSTKL